MGAQPEVAVAAVEAVAVAEAEVVAEVATTKASLVQTSHEAYVQH